METKHDILRRRSAYARKFVGGVILKSMELHARLLGRFASEREWSDFSALKFLEFFRPEVVQSHLPVRRDYVTTLHETYAKYLVSLRVNPVVREFMQAASGEKQRPAGRIVRVVRNVQSVSPAITIHAAREGEHAATMTTPAGSPAKSEFAGGDTSSSRMVTAEYRPRKDTGEAVQGSAREGSVDEKAFEKAAPPHEASATELREQQARRIFHKYEKSISKIVKRSLEELGAPVILRPGVGESAAVFLRKGELDARASQSAVSRPREAVGGRPWTAASMGGQRVARGPENNSLVESPMQVAAIPAGASPVSTVQPIVGKSVPRFARPAPLVHAKQPRAEAAREIVKAVKAARREQAPPAEFVEQKSMAPEMVEQTLKETLRNLPRRDLELITERVYRGIERRIVTDADRKGFRD